MEATSMTDSLLSVAASTPSMALRYAAAFFLVVVGIGLIYALIRLGGTLGSAEKLLTDVDTEVVPLLKQATETLDGVNTELDKIGVVMTSVVDATEKVDHTTRAVESAISVPARKAAAFGAGVSQAVSSFFSRGSDSDEAATDAATGATEDTATTGAWRPTGAPDAATSAPGFASDAPDAAAAPVTDAAAATAAAPETTPVTDAPPPAPPAPGATGEGSGG
jgi:uncharacterized protein YoxC